MKLAHPPRHPLWLFSGSLPLLAFGGTPKHAMSAALPTPEAVAARGAPASQRRSSSDVLKLNAEASARARPHSTMLPAEMPPITSAAAAPTAAGAPSATWGEDAENAESGIKGSTRPGDDGTVNSSDRRAAGGSNEGAERTIAASKTASSGGSRGKKTGNRMLKEALALSKFDEFTTKHAPQSEKHGRVLIIFHVIMVC